MPIAFASRFLNPAEAKYSINELELLAVVWSVEYFKNYVYGRHFTVRTDHRALLSALKSNRGNKTTFSRLARWVDRLLPYTFEITHIPGKDMGFADYMSRFPTGPPAPLSTYDQNFSIVSCTRAVGKLLPFFSALNATSKLSARSAFDHSVISHSHSLCAFSTEQTNSHCFAPGQLSHSTCIHSDLVSVSHSVAAVCFMATPASPPASPTPSTISSEVEARLYPDPPVSPPAPRSSTPAPATGPASPTSLSSSSPSVLCLTPAAVVPPNTAAAAPQPGTPPPTSLSRDQRNVGPPMAAQFSTEMIRVLTQPETQLQQVLAALRGSANQRKRVGAYWADLWKDIHESDGCLFLDDEVILPELLRAPFLQLLHSTHAGARAMLSRCDHVWFPHLYKTIQAVALTVFNAPQWVRTLLVFPTFINLLPVHPYTPPLRNLKLISWDRCMRTPPLSTIRFGRY